MTTRVGFGSGGQVAAVGSVFTPGGPGFPAGVFTPVSWTTLITPPPDGSMTWSGAQPTRLVFTVPGALTVTSKLAFATTPGVTALQAFHAVSGGALFTNSYAAPAGPPDFSPSFTDVWTVVAGDYLEVFVQMFGAAAPLAASRQMAQLVHD